MIAVVIVFTFTNAERWHGWDWHIWDPLVAIGTLALAGATIALARSTQELSRRTADEIAASHAARRHEAERAQIERVYQELLSMIETLNDQHSQGGDFAARLRVSRARLRAAIVVAGGAGRWPQTDLMVREGGGDRNALVRQTDSAVRELNSALGVLNASE